MKVIILICAVVLILFVLKLSMNDEKKKICLRFEDRASISIEQFYREYYISSDISLELIEELLLHVANELSLPVEKIRPSDRFDSELAPERGWNWDSGLGMLSVELQELAKEQGVKIDLAKIVTLDDYLRIAASLWYLAPKK